MRQRGLGLDLGAQADRWRQRRHAGDGGGETAAGGHHGEAAGAALRLVHVLVLQT